MTIKLCAFSLQFYIVAVDPLGIDPYVSPTSGSSFPSSAPQEILQRQGVLQQYPAFDQGNLVPPLFQQTSLPGLYLENAYPEWAKVAINPGVAQPRVFGTTLEKATLRRPVASVFLQQQETTTSAASEPIALSGGLGSQFILLPVLGTLAITVCAMFCCSNIAGSSSLYYKTNVLKIGEIAEAEAKAMAKAQAGEVQTRDKSIEHDADTRDYLMILGYVGPGPEGKGRADLFLRIMAEAKDHITEGYALKFKGDLLYGIALSSAALVPVVIANIGAFDDPSINSQLKAVGIILSVAGTLSKLLDENFLLRERGKHRVDVGSRMMDAFNTYYSECASIDVQKVLQVREHLVTQSLLHPDEGNKHWADLSQEDQGKQTMMVIDNVRTAAFNNLVKKYLALQQEVRKAFMQSGGTSLSEKSSEHEHEQRHGGATYAMPGATYAMQPAMQRNMQRNMPAQPTPKASAQPPSDVAQDQTSASSTTRPTSPLISHH